MKKKKLKQPKFKVSGYKRLLLQAKKKKKSCFITEEEYGVLKSKPCSVCNGVLEPASSCTVLVNKRKQFTIDNVVMICRLCQLIELKGKFDPVKHAKSLLRRNWKRTPMAIIALYKAKRPGGWECVKCHKVFKKRQYDLDHKQPTVDVSKTDENDMNSFIKNLFCDDSNLQVLCKEHHKEKTQRENNLRIIIDKAKK